MITIEAGMPVHYPTLLKIWESSVRATHDFLPEEDIEALRPLLENLYFPAVTLSIARLVEDGSVVGFVGVSDNRIEMLFVGALAIIWAASRFTSLSRTALFWAAFILTRPLGAVVGDFLDKPVAAGGLALSRYSASLTLALIIMAFLWLLPQRPAMKVAVTN